ncbi:MAG: hypothetical protein JW808_01550 [Victivallales bacterium]|nr:hypothetical protein [Victivallales bacterium]
MKLRLFVLGLLAFLLVLPLSSTEFKTEGYEEVDEKTLELKPEDYRNKKIFYQGVYASTQTSFPPYVERSGIKAGKHYWLLVTPHNLPVIVKKGKDFDEPVAALKRNSTLKLYGKIKKFKYKPDLSTLPQYYLDLDYLEVIEEAEDAEEPKTPEEKWRERVRDIKERERLFRPPLPPK